MTRLVSTDSPGWVQEGAAVLLGGGLVAFPTDTVYGVGARVMNGEAVAKIYRAKGRPEEKSIAVLVSSALELEGLAAMVPEGVQRLAAAFWPGPLTLVLPKRAGIPVEVSSGETIGVRVPAHPVALELLKAVGPLATSSANRSGEPDLTRPEDVLAALAGGVDLVVDGGVAPGGSPSTVVDCSGSEPVILRRGPIAEEDIQEAWRGT